MKPKITEPIKRLKMLSFRVDDETLEALERIMTAGGPGSLNNRRSGAIRAAILEKAARLKSGV